MEKVKKMDAYYRTESNAESAKAKLETLKVEKVLVERVPDSSRNGLMEVIKNMFTDDTKDHHHDPQILHVEVADEDFAEANKIVQESEGFISKE
ncbi:hypothetical protein [Virgibacillus necropolis]|uniref:Uncharacterized protein n=1 Tax=Virgibacillus necropolis TaxID=163877 RepID=A0A221MA44_9BACI|nr:hypothetical protein [Virgibacillus necropolis]ASN04526.1 hypothetical protein CFK40_05625 [Virgibacillus necropolis]